MDAVKAELEAHGLRPEVGAMSTQAVGDTETVFAALRDAFVRMAASGQVVHDHYGLKCLPGLGARAAAWEIFQRSAGEYEHWYATGCGATGGYR